MDWDSAARIPWGVILLFGGGLSLASAITKTQLSTWLGQSLVELTSVPTLVLLFALVAFVIMTTEIVSNIATGGDPIFLSLPIAMAASCAFMLPIATGPNAIAYSTGVDSLPKLARVDLILNVFGIALIPLVIHFIAPQVFGG